MINSQPAIGLLRNHGFRVTDQRLVLLKFLMQTPQAYTLAELEQTLPLDQGNYLPLSYGVGRKRSAA